jgi:hypothetical protein
MRIKKAEIDANREAQRKMQCFDALVANISLQRLKDAKEEKALTFRRTELWRSAFALLKAYYVGRRTIKNDKLLWKAHTSDD